MDVTRRGDYYNGYIYTVAFLTPVGYIEPVIVDVSQVEVSSTLIICYFYVLLLYRCLTSLCKCSV